MLEIAKGHQLFLVIEAAQSKMLIPQSDPQSCVACKYTQVLGHYCHDFQSYLRSIEFEELTQILRRMIQLI